MKTDIMERLKYVCENNYRLTEISRYKINFDVGRPQGLVSFNNVFVLSSVYLSTNSSLESRGELNFMTRNGSHIKSLDVTEGEFFHPGGMSIDGTKIMLPLAKFREHSDSKLYELEFDSNLTINSSTYFDVDDHIGVALRIDEEVVGYNWGSKKTYRFHNEQIEITGSINRYLFYQDCNILNENYYICLGRKEHEIPEVGQVSIGGLDVIDIRDFSLNCTIPIDLWLKPYIPIAKGAFWIESLNDDIRLYFVPEYNSASIYEYSLAPEESFTFGENSGQFSDN